MDFHTALDVESMMEALLEAIVIPACVIDRQFQVANANPEFISLTKAENLKTVKEKPLEKLIMIDLFECDSDIIDKLIEHKEAMKRIAIKGRLPSGRLLQLFLSIVPYSKFIMESPFMLLLFQEHVTEEVILEKYQQLYALERKEREKIEESNNRLNELVDKKVLE
ncbi:MAG: hypothetical protein JW795_02600, partial [Chitinivibrionales bacterium]|nr:hypothetical protein [Chitinivibrionales bacterium]